MSNQPSDEIEQVEATVEPKPIGLPKSLAKLSPSELAAQLREWRKPKEQPDESQP